MKEHIIFDLDGTLADDAHRLHYITQYDKDYPKYFSLCMHDKPIWHIIGLFKACKIAYPDRKIWIISGRCESVRHETEMWLKYYDIYYDELILRPKECPISTVLWKEQVIKSSILDNKEVIILAFDDNKQVINMFRSHGITALHVADEDY